MQPGTISQKFLLFNELCNTAYRTCFPLKTKFISIKRIKKPWIDATIFQIIKTKSHYFKLYRLGIISKSENNKYKNMLNNKIRHARKLYYRNSFDKCRNDIKATWKLIKSNLSPSYCRRNINSIIVNDCEIVDEEVMADNFNSYRVGQNRLSSLEESLLVGRGREGGVGGFVPLLRHSHFSSQHVVDG